jgi:hydrogenase nickel incorporation protein HypB
MCATCGCADHSAPTLTNLQTGETMSLDIPHAHVHDHVEGQRHDHNHAHLHGHAHHHGDGRHDHVHHHAPHGRLISLDQEILAKNNRLAERNRGWLAGRGILALNIVSAPGAGKTTLLERTLRDLGRELPFHVIEGDQATLQDAERIQATGCPVVQINTGAGCHLDASMVGRGLETLDPPAGSVVLVENVGNLVCPALFDLGERAKILVCSVTEGDDKPLKYPHMFQASALVLLNKIDLLPYVPFDLERFRKHLHQVHASVPLLLVSAARGDGLAEWYGWLRSQRTQRQHDETLRT